jgi:hypothetical protein
MMNFMNFRINKYINKIIFRLNLLEIIIIPKIIVIILRVKIKVLKKKKTYIRKNLL